MKKWRQYEIIICINIYRLCDQRNGNQNVPFKIPFILHSWWLMVVFTSMFCAMYVFWLNCCFHFSQYVFSLLLHKNWFNVSHLDLNAFAGYPLYTPYFISTRTKLLSFAFFAILNALIERVVSRVPYRYIIYVQ